MKFLDDLEEVVAGTVDRDDFGANVFGRNQLLDHHQQGAHFGAFQVKGFFLALQGLHHQVKGFIVVLLEGDHINYFVFLQRRQGDSQVEQHRPKFGQPNLGL